MSVMLAAVVPILAAVIVHLLVRTVALHHLSRLGPGDARSAVREWAGRVMAHVVAPLAALLWIAALHATLAALLPVLLSNPAPAAAVAGLAAVRNVALAIASVWLATRAAQLFERTLATVTSRTASAWDDALVPVAGRAIRVLVPIATATLVLPLLPLAQELRAGLRTAGTLVLIGAIAYLLYQAIDAAATLVLGRYELDVRDNLEARSIHTQVLVLKKTATAVLMVFTAGSMLMVFEPVRQFGTSILASAGIAGIIVGLAAQRSIATLLAGLQLAMTQPIRLDDVVIVDGEWGRIEDITLTYVTVRIWDQRRLIVPITRFIEQPFENWTRRSADILGSVFLYVDYGAPIDAVRAELERILHASAYWDGKVSSLQVTEAGERTLQIRALMSAADASLAWDLRCEVREKLVGFLQREHPGSLPRLRADLHTVTGIGSPA